MRTVGDAAPTAAKGAESRAASGASVLVQIDAANVTDRLDAYEGRAPWR